MSQQRLSQFQLVIAILGALGTALYFSFRLGAFEAQVTAELKHLRVTVEQIDTRYRATEAEVIRLRASRDQASAY
jgi:hypothetical protein